MGFAHINKPTEGAGGGGGRPEGGREMKALEIWGKLVVRRSVIPFHGKRQSGRKVSPGEKKKAV